MTPTDAELLPGGQKDPEGLPERRRGP